MALELALAAVASIVFIPLLVSACAGIRAARTRARRAARMERFYSNLY